MRRTMKIKLTAGWEYGALIVLLALWTLHGFVEALLAACVTAVIRLAGRRLAQRAVKARRLVSRKPSPSEDPRRSRGDSTSGGVGCGAALQ
jgi:hypothetical protein